MYLMYHSRLMSQPQLQVRPPLSLAFVKCSEGLRTWTTSLLRHDVSWSKHYCRHL